MNVEVIKARNTPFLKIYKAGSKQDSGAFAVYHLAIDLLNFHLIWKIQSNLASTQRNTKLFHPKKQQLPYIQCEPGFSI